MGKIVKYCSSCDEGFAEKFGFCPNCGQGLEAFEMNPVQAAAPPVVETAPAAPPPIVEPAPAAPSVVQSAPVVAAAPIVEAAPATEELETVERIQPAEVVQQTESADESILELEPEDESEVVTGPLKAPAIAPVPAFVHSNPIDVDNPGTYNTGYRPTRFEAAHDAAVADGGFYVTVIEEKNANQRNYLLLGTLGFMIMFMMGLTVYSLFAKDLGVAAIGGDDMFLASLVDVPMAIEEEKPKKNKDDGGGGGGGGREEKEEVNKGDLADQSPNPIRPPDVHVPRLENPSLTLPPATTQGNQKFEKVYDRYGDPNGRFDNLSNGPGTGGGIGSGRGTGQGNGIGTGAGNGIGSGYGNGNGNGNGNGTGDGDGGTGGAPPPKHVGVTQPLSILSKPRPGYTDSARQANIQGTVILRVTFNANGSIGGISPVKGLPNGLTEQAIAAARRISFEPKKVDGVGQSVTKQIEYTFSIY